MNWLVRLLRRKHNGDAAAVEEAEKVQVTQFEDWANVYREVERVQNDAKGARKARQGKI